MQGGNTGDITGEFPKKLEVPPRQRYWHKCSASVCGEGVYTSSNTGSLTRLCDSLSILKRRTSHPFCHEFSCAVFIAVTVSKPRFRAPASFCCWYEDSAVVCTGSVLATINKGALTKLRHAFSCSFHSDFNSAISGAIAVCEPRASDIN